MYKALSLLTFFWIFIPFAWAGDEEKLYQKKATWHETLLSFREAEFEYRKKVKPTVPLPDLGKDDLTLLAWIKTEEGGTLCAKAPPGDTWAPQGKTFFVRGGRLSFDIGWVGCVASQTKVDDNKWHHVALTCEEETIRLYIDGELDETGALRRKPDIEEHLFKVGFTNDNYPEPSGYEGLIDEMRFFIRKLSDLEIKDYFKGKIPEQERGLRAYWPFDGDGKDLSGRENNALRLEEAAFIKGKKGKALSLEGEGFILFSSGKGAGLEDLLWTRLARDFPDPRSQKEMAWEREDRIWQEEWVPGDWADLAQRYARAGNLPQTAAGVIEIRNLYYQSRRYGEALDLLKAAGPEGLREAITFLRNEYGSQYGKADTCLARLNAIIKEVRSWESKRIKDEDLHELEESLEQLKKEALFIRNPLIDFHEILFVRRFTYQSSHYYTDYIDGCHHYGGNLCILSLKDHTVRTLVPELEGGIFGRFDLSFDGKKIVFDYKASPREGFRIYETGVDGKGLRRLTSPPPDEAERIRKYDNSHLGGTGEIYYHQTDDMHPCYLPDGGICFISTRCERGILCDGADILTTTSLYRMDGSDLTLLSYSPVSEEAPTMMNDGRILYTRWEYVDKGGSAVKCLWAMRPDGTGTVEIFGNDHAFPSFYNGRAVSGHNNLFVTIGGPHMPLGVGTVILLDINKPIRTREPMTYLTPEIDIQSEWGYRHLKKEKWLPAEEGPLFDDPYPLSPNFFLVTFNRESHVHDLKAYDLYLLDAFGNRVLLFDDPEMSCWQPIPLKPRSRPPMLPSVLPEEPKPLALMAVSDVYEGLDPIPRGTVKYLRVMETLSRPWAARRFWGGDEHGQQHSVVSLWTHTHVKVLHGIVPVEADGSAHFFVPADRNIFFQVLDEDYMEVQRMRTFVDFLPGEKRSCIGCHELRNRAPPNKKVIALTKPPVQPKPQPGDKGPRPIHYPRDVQPIWDRHCIRCHSGDDPEADLDLSGGLTTLFNRSYEEIIERDLVKAVSEIRYKMGNVDETPPYTWGSHASPLITRLRAGHNKVVLSKEEFIRLVTWVDANAPYYGTYFGRKNLRYKDHPDFRPAAGTTK